MVFLALAGLARPVNFISHEENEHDHSPVSRRRSPCRSYPDAANGGAAPHGLPPDGVAGLVLLSSV